MRQGQRELMNEYLIQIEKSNDRPKELQHILKKEERLVFKILDVVFLVLILAGLLWGYQHGAYTKNEITIDCQGEITTSNNPEKYPTGNILLPNLTVIPKEDDEP